MQPMNAVVLQCGGPTAVVNHSLGAVVRRWREVSRAGELFGGRYGLAALSTGDWLPLAAVDDKWLSSAEASPGMVLGGGRDRLDDVALGRAVASLASRNVDTLFLIGGNGTMAAGRAIAGHAAQAGVPLRTVCIPKTIDNDIPATDVCPGFASAARFLIEAVRDVAADVTSMRGYEDVVLIESMGRHSGWLTVATLLARSAPDDPPHLVLLPERPLSSDWFVGAVREQHRRSGMCIAVVAEGVRDEHGAFLAERLAGSEVERDASGQVILGRSGGPLPYLASLVRARLALRCRVVRPDVLQRCSRAHVVEWDRRIAALAGAAAVDWAAEAEHGQAVMIAIRRQSDDWRTETVPLDRVHGERPLPSGPDAIPGPLRRLLSS